MIKMPIWLKSKKVIIIFFLVFDFLVYMLMPTYNIDGETTSIDELKNEQSIIKGAANFLVYENTEIKKLNALNELLNEDLQRVGLRSYVENNNIIIKSLDHNPKIKFHKIFIEEDNTFSVVSVCAFYENQGIGESEIPLFFTNKVKDLIITKISELKKIKEEPQMYFVCISNSNDGNYDWRIVEAEELLEENLKLMFY